MLQIKDVRKQYVTGDLVQDALNGVSLNLRDNEFVAILGPSGSGKTTLLNIIGGLDRYDSGDLIINGISTRKYTDKDWDSYRNHTIGFVFQSYNLIPHQTVLSNVELALTISGISADERKRRALDALDQVGLKDQAHKKPNQMSGGQMQRVAIARALVNNPDTLLADEPTGALDTKTSVQIMDLLKEVASDRLVVMVTHNPELANTYANRIVQLKDGNIISDTNPLIIENETETIHKNMGKSSMSFLTSLSLSFNNLLTKKGRTFLTAFAGSIGIIGIALILSLSNGVQTYINNIEEETLSEYPLTIQKTSMDFTSFMLANLPDSDNREKDVHERQIVSSLVGSTNTNDLKSLKRFFEGGTSGIEQYVNGIEYNFSVVPQIFKLSDDGKSYRKVNPDETFSSLVNSTSVMSAYMSNSVFNNLPASSKLYEGQYDLILGKWPQDYHDCLLVVTGSGYISDLVLYTLGLKDAAELDKIFNGYINGETVEIENDPIDLYYEDLLGIEFRLVKAADYYQYDSEYGVYVDKTTDKEYMLDMLKNSEVMKIVGIVRPSENSRAAMLSSGIYYHSSLIEHVIDMANESEILKAQMADKETDVFTGNKFGEAEDKTIAMQDIFSIDTDAISEAFSFNNTNISIKPTDFDLSGILSSVNTNLSTADLSQIANDIMNGYMKYASADPATDYQNLGQAMNGYFTSGRANEVISNYLEEVSFHVPTADEVTGMLQDIMAGFPAYLESLGIEDYSNIAPYLNDYLNSEEAQSKIGGYLSQLAEENSELISQDNVQKMTDELYNDYLAYARENDLPDPSKLSESFSAYLATSEGRKIMQNAIGKVVDTNKLSNALAKSLSSQMTRIMNQIANSFTFDADAFQKAINFSMDAKQLQELMMSMMNTEYTSYEKNLSKLNYCDKDDPQLIYIYSKDFNGKEEVVKILDGYNERMEALKQDDKIIGYTDYVATLMGSVTTIVDTISYVLIAFVAISLVVSSIMIGIITYISVLERTKEIGILRAIGASKRNVSQVFSAETFIIGLLSGVLGIIASILILIPGNALIHHLTDNPNVNAILPPIAGVILIIISVILTLIGGIIPSRAAARKDPVTALRTE